MQRPVGITGKGQDVLIQSGRLWEADARRKGKVGLKWDDIAPGADAVEDQRKAFPLEGCYLVRCVTVKQEHVRLNVLGDELVGGLYLMDGIVAVGRGVQV